MEYKFWIALVYCYPNCSIYPVASGGTSDSNNNHAAERSAIVFGSHRLRRNISMNPRIPRTTIRSVSMGARCGFATTTIGIQVFAFYLTGDDDNDDADDISSGANEHNCHDNEVG